MYTEWYSASGKSKVSKSQQPPYWKATMYEKTLKGKYQMIMEFTTIFEHMVDELVQDAIQMFKQEEETTPETGPETAEGTHERTEGDESS